MTQENLKQAQDKLFAYNHLVTNFVLLHNVDAMSQAFNKLKPQGFSSRRRSSKQFVAFLDRTYQLARNILAEDSSSSDEPAFQIGIGS